MAQVENRKRQIGQTPIANIEEGFRRNYEIGITTGIQSVTGIFRTMVETAKKRYVELLTKDRGEIDDDE